MKTKILILLLFINHLWGFQPVDINLASLEQIALLPGVGEKLAQNILDYRNKNGPILNEEDFLKVEGLTSKKFLKLDNLVIFSSQIKKNNKRTKIILKKPVIPLFELEKKVLKTEGLDCEIEKDLQKRARLFAWLPELSAMVDFGNNNFLTEKNIDSHNDYSLSRRGADIGFGIKATFDLGKLIFNQSELEVIKLSLVRMKKREEILDKLHKSYFNYLSLSEQEVFDIKEAKKIEKLLEKERAIMDSMSNQAFSKFQK